MILLANTSVRLDVFGLDDSPGPLSLGDLEALGLALEGDQQVSWGC